MADDMRGLKARKPGGVAAVKRTGPKVRKDKNVVARRKGDSLGPDHGCVQGRRVGWRNVDCRNLTNKGLADGQKTAWVKFVGPVGFGDGQQANCQGVGSDQWVTLRVLAEGEPGDGRWPVVDLVIVAQKCGGDGDA